MPKEPEPADYDPDDDPAADWANAKATEIAPPPADILAEAIPEAVDEAVTGIVEPKTPRPEHTGRHRMTPAMFASAVDLADRDAYARGEAAGYRRGLADGRAQVSAEDWEDGVECALRGMRLWMATNGIVNVDAMTTAARPFIKRGG